jgi:hypothetical protein
MGRIDEGDLAFTRQCAELRELFRMLSQFGGVAPAKFLSTVRFVPEPFPQFGARRDVLGPLIDGRIHFFDAARPKPIDQDPHAVIG